MYLNEQHSSKHQNCKENLKQKHMSTVNRKSTRFTKLHHGSYLTFLDNVCLFGVYRPTREFFTHMETSPLPVKDCKFLTYAQHSWPLSSEVSLACLTYCDTSDYNDHLRGVLTLTPGAVTTCFYLRRQRRKQV